MTYCCTWVEVDLGEIDTEDLIAELKERDIHVPNIESTDSVSTIELIWIKRRQGLDYQSDLDKLIYDVLGKTV